jgi:hypothetical protein
VVGSVTQDLRSQTSKAEDPEPPLLAAVKASVEAENWESRAGEPEGPGSYDRRNSGRYEFGKPSSEPGEAGTLGSF